MPKPDVRDQRVPQILHAAAEVCSEVGIDKASMVQIAQKAGISKAAIYHYFTSKEEMIEALVRMLFEADNEGVELLLDTHISVRKAVVEYVRSLALLLEQHRRIFPVYAEIRVVALRNERVNNIISSYYQRYMELFRDLVKRGVANGEFPAATTTDDVALSLTATIEGAILLSQNVQGSLCKMLETSVTVLLDALSE